MIDPNLLPEQNNQLATWAEKRDTLLVEVSQLETEKDRLTNINKGLSDSNTEITEKMISSIARMAELDKQEKEYEGICSVEIAELQKNKTFLETAVSGLQKEVAVLSDRKEGLTSTINTLTTLHDQVFSRAGNLDKVVEHVTRVNKQNIEDTNIMISGLKGSIQEVVDLSKKSIDDANKVMVDLPRFIFDLRKKLIRKPLE